MYSNYNNRSTFYSPTTVWHVDISTVSMYLWFVIFSGNSTGNRTIKFHNVHGENVKLLNDNTLAKREISYCKAICFSSRPIAINEKVLIRFVETSSIWDGVLSFGFTNIDPGSFRGSDLPQSASPDLKKKQGCWVETLEKRYAVVNNVLHFYVTGNGDVMYGINGKDFGLLFSGVSTVFPLWALLDIYGNTIGIEFVNHGKHPGNIDFVFINILLLLLGNTI